MLLRWQSKQWIGGHATVKWAKVLSTTAPVDEDIAEKLSAVELQTPMEALDRHWLHITRLRRYVYFVRASYGWLYFYSEYICNLRTVKAICSHLSYSNPNAPDKQMDMDNGIRDPGGCLCAGRNAYLAAFLEVSGLDSEHILLFDIPDSFYEAAVMFVIDDDTQAIVLIVRGTHSGDDTLVDLIAFGLPLRDVDNLPETRQTGERFMAHGGMVRVAQRLSKRMVEEQWVERARERRPNYPLVLCGHSLGAGIVSLMAVLLQPNYPELKAYAFSPPGALMNEPLANFTHNFVCSIIYGCDAIGRVSVSTMEDLRARLFHALVVCDVPKTQLITGKVLNTVLRFFMPFLNLSANASLDKLLSDEVKSKLIYPDLEDVYTSTVGWAFKAHEAEMIGGVTQVDRLLPGDRSLFNWKKLSAQVLLRIPRPYSKRILDEVLHDCNTTTLDTIYLSMKGARCSSRILHILEVEPDSDGNEVLLKKNRQMKTSAPIAIWSDSCNFNTILVHPKMVLDHSPVYLSVAIDRLCEAIIDEPGDNSFYGRTIDSADSPLTVFRDRSERQEDDYCRVRKLKSLQNDG